MPPTQSPVPYIVDLSHHDSIVDFGELKAAGIVGVILKATQGISDVDPTFADRYPRAVEVFGTDCVHVYHFLDDSDPVAQIEHLRSVTTAFAWLDYEPNPNGPTCPLETAVAAAQALYGHLGRWGGIYGGDEDLLGQALGAGHFDACPKWIARYRSTWPDHACQLWQFAEGVDGSPTVAGQLYDLSTFNGTADECQDWMSSL